MSITPEIAELRAMRDRLCALARLQAKLLVALRADFHQSGMTKNAYATSLGVSHGEVHRCLDEGKVVSNDKLLTSLSQHIGSALTEEMRRGLVGLNERSRGLIACPPEAIAAAFDLKEAYATVAAKGNTVPFCELFGTYGELVDGALNDHAYKIAELGDAAVRDAVRNHLSSDWRERFTAIMARNTSDRAVLAQTFAELDRQLRPRFASMEEYARIFGVSPSTCRGALRGETTAAQTTELIATARRLLRNEDEPADPVPPATPAAKVRAPTLAQVLERHGGVTSAHGIPFVLTSESFEMIDGDPGDAFVTLTQQQLRLARGLLNIAAQLKDDHIRGRIRVALTPEVNELNASIGMFTFAHPSKLTETYDAQRRTLEAIAPEPPAPRRRK